MAPLQPYHSEHLQQLQRLIESEGIVSHDITRRASATDYTLPRFIANGRIERHFWEPENNFRRVRNLLRAVFNSEDTGADQFNVSPRDLAENCSKVFCILIRIGRPEFIETFVAYESLWDAHLPFGSSPPDGFPRVPTDPEFYHEFVKEQWQFCALKVQNRSCLRVPKDRILPFVSSKRIGGGGTATVHRVEIHPEHDAVIPSSGSSHVYAIKTFRSHDAEGNFDRELKAFRQVTDAGSRAAPGLIEFYGSFEYRGTFSIILQYADAGTLEQLFMRDEPPNAGDEIIAFWSNLFEIIKGICQIHEQHLHTENGTNQISAGVLLQGWHQDVKPENILVFNNPTGSPYAHSFKIADLGHCHFKTIMAGGPEAKDFDTFGTQTYGAPECHQMTAYSELRSNLIKRNVDIWSLGCIFSESYVWIMKGAEGLKAFRLARKRATDAIPGWNGGDCFHNGHEMLEEVPLWLEGLKPDYKFRDYASGRVLEQMIYGTLRREPSTRPSARVMEANAETLLRSARNELQRASLITPPTPSSGLNPQSPSQPHGSPPQLHGSPALPSPVKTPDNRVRNASAPPPPVWNFGGERVIYTTPQVSQNDHTHFVDMPYPTATSSQQPAHRYPSSRILERELPVRPSLQDSIQTQAAQNFDHQFNASNSTPVPATPHESFGQPGPSTTPIDLSLQTSPEALSQESDRGPRLRPLSSDVPFCSLEVAKAWHAKKKKEEDGWHTRKPDGDKLALLPHNGLMSELAGRDHVFFIDDSTSMARLWDQVSELAHLLTYMTKRMDPDGVELYFLSSNSNKRHTFKKSTKLYETVCNHKANAVTNLHQCFDDNLRSYARELEQTNHYNKTHHKFMRRDFPRKRSIYVLTDGVLDSGVESQGHDAIKVLVEKLVDASLPRGQIGIQFIGFGDNVVGLERLRKLDRLNKDEGFALDVVDTEPANGNVWKMLLGAINERFDDDEPDSLASRPSASSSSR